MARPAPTSGARTLEGEVPTKRTEHTLPEGAGKVLGAKLAGRRARKQEPLKVIALHMLDSKATTFENLLHAPPQKKMFHGLETST